MNKAEKISKRSIEDQSAHFIVGKITRLDWKIMSPQFLIADKLEHKLCHLTK